MSGKGYPYYDNDNYGQKFRRSPFDERSLRDLDRAGNPYASQSSKRYDRDERRRQEDRRRPPIITVNEPPERQRKSITPLERAGEYGAFLRDSATPPPKASMMRVDPFEKAFGDVAPPERPCREERLHYEPPGPSNPFSTSRREREREDRRNERREPVDPYGGGRAPTNPFLPGGAAYDDAFKRARRDPVAEISDQERRRRDHYRSGVGEEWGLAKYKAYEERRRMGL